MLSPMSDWFTTPVDVVITVIIGYLIGSIPIANLIAHREAEVDLREIGDGNPGFWNARETLGRRAALPVFVGDVLKGVAAAGLGWLLADDGVWGLPYVGGGAAMVGHAFPLFAGFVGGRSVLTFVGAMLVAAPIPSVFAIGIGAIAFAITRSFAWAARVAMVAFPLCQLVVEGPSRTAASGVLMTFIGLRFVLARDRATVSADS
jgi:glycerol-3-phosphate acyltransferase PlsY